MQLQNLGNIGKAFLELKSFASISEATMTATDFTEIGASLSQISAEAIAAAASMASLSAEQTSAALTAAGYGATEAAAAMAINGFDATTVAAALASQHLSATQIAGAMSATQFETSQIAAALALQNFDEAAIVAALEATGLSSAEAAAAATATTITAANGSAAVATTSLAASFEAAAAGLATFLLTNPVGWAALATGAIFGVVKVTDALTESFDEACDKADEARSTYDSALNDVKDVESQQDSLRSKVEELATEHGVTFTDEDTIQDIINKLKELKLSTTDAQSLSALETTNAQLSSQLAIKQKIAEYDQKSAAKAASNVIDKKRTWGSGEYDVDASTGASYEKIKSGTIVDETLSKREKLTSVEQQLTDYYKQQQSLIDSGQDKTSKWWQSATEYEKVTDNIKNLEEQRDSLTSDIKDNLDVISDNYTSLLDENGEVLPGFETEKEKIDNLYDSVLSADNANKQLSESENEASDNAQKVSDAYGDASDSITQTSDAAMTAAQNLVSGISAAQEAINGQSTGKSISLTDFNSDELKDYQSALEYVNGTMQLNAEKVREIAKAKADEQIAINDSNKALEQSKYLENAGQIEKLRASLANATDSQKEEIQKSIDSLLAENSTIADTCRQYDLLSSSIEESVGAYQNWLNAQNAAQSGDMFDSAISAINKIDDTLNNSESDSYGRIGNSDYKAALEFIIPDTIDSDDQKAVDSYLDSVSDYLTTDENGNFNGMDIDNFCKKAVDAGLLTLDESGENYKLAGEHTMQDFADGLNLSLPFVQAIFGEMEEFGAEFDWADEGVKTLGDLGVEANEAAESLRKVKGNEDLKIIMDVSDFDNTETACQTLDATIAEMEKVKKVSVDSSQVEQANAVIQYCVAQKQQLTAPAVMSVDTSKVEGGMGTFLSLLQQFQEAKNDLDMKASVGADTSEAEEKLNSLKSKIQEASQETDVKAKVDIDTSSVDSIQSYISGLKPEAIVKLGVDSSLIDGYKPKDSDATVKYETDTSKPDGYKPDDKKATVTYNVNHSLVDAYDPSNLKRTVTYTIVTKGTPPSGGSGGVHGVNGTAHVAGTAMAGGNWGTASGGRTLVGELGTEIIVDPRSGRWYTVGDSGAEFVDVPKNAIVFNHKQSESLLQYGYVAGRGTAAAWGTAMVRGSIPVSQTKKYNSSQNRNSWSSSGNNKKSTSSSKSSGSTSSKGKSGSSKSGNKSTKKGKTTAQKFQNWLSGMFDFAEVRLTILNRLTEKWSDKAEKAVRYSYNQTASDSSIDRQYQNKQTYTQKAITATGNEIKGNEKAANTYTKFMNKISKKGGLKAADRKRIRDDTVNGTFNIKKYNADGKKLAAIKEYQTYYEKVLSCKDSVEDLKQSQMDLYDQLYKIPLDQAAAKVEKYENALSRLSKTLSAVSGGSKVYLDQVVSDTQSAYNAANTSSTSTKKAYTSAQKSQNTAQKSFNKAQKKAKNTKGLSKSQKNAIKAGKAVSTKGLSGKALKKVRAYNASRSNLNSKNRAAASAKSAYSYASANRSSALQALREAQAVQKKYANQPAYKYQNYLLDQETKQKKNENTAQQAALRQANKNLSDTQKAKNSAIATRDNKKKTVDSKASSTLKKYSKNLSASQKKALKSGQTVSTKGLSGKALKAVKDYNAALKSYKSSAAAATTASIKYNAAVEAQAEADQNAAETQAEYTQAIQENAKAKFDNVSTSFESKQAITNAKISKLNTQLSYRESKGYSQTSNDQKAVYQNSISENQNLLASQQQELAALEAAYRENSANMSEADRNSAQAEIESLRESILKTDATISDLQTDLNNIEVKKLEISMDRIKAQGDALQDALDLNDTKGIAATAEEYRKLISNSDSQIANLQKQNEEYRKQQQGLSVDSVKYQDLQSKIESNDSAIRSAQKSQEEWNNSIANLPYDRIEKLLDNLDAIADLNKSMSDLKSALGEDLTEDDYLQQIADNNEKISQLESERTQAYQDYLKALADADGVYGGKTADEWLSQYNQFGTQINNIKADNADIKKDMRDDVLWRTYDRAHDSCERYADVLSGIKDLIDEDMYFDKDGNLTDYGVAQVANLVGEYENARKEVQNYSNDIANLNDLYSKGYYTQEEYNEKLAELQKNITDSASDMKSAMKEITDMYKDMAQSELDNLFKIIDARNKALSAKKAYIIMRLSILLRGSPHNPISLQHSWKRQV